LPPASLDQSLGDGQAGIECQARGKAQGDTLVAGEERMECHPRPARAHPFVDLLGGVLRERTSAVEPLVVAWSSPKRAYNRSMRAKQQA
jgi:hypothetical protein